MKKLDFYKSDQAREYIAYFCKTFQERTGKAMTQITTSAGRVIELDHVPDADVGWVATDLYQMEIETRGAH